MVRKIPGLPIEWENFVFCLILHLTLPLVPLALEQWFSGHIEAKSATLTAAMYSMAIGRSSRSVALFGLGVLQGLAFSAAFGFLSTQNELAHADSFSYSAILLIMIFHSIERYNRHVIDQAPFLEFVLRKNSLTQD